MCVCLQAVGWIEGITWTGNVCGTKFQVSVSVNYLHNLTCLGRRHALGEGTLNKAATVKGDSKLDI